MGLRICLRFPWHASPRTSRRTSTQSLDMEENPFIIATTVRAKRLGRGIVMGSPIDKPLALPTLIRRTSFDTLSYWNVSSTYSLASTRKKCVPATLLGIVTTLYHAIMLPPYAPALLLQVPLPRTTTPIHGGRRQALTSKEQFLVWWRANIL